TVQVLIFIVVSLVMLLGLRPYLLRNLRRRMPLVETNTAAHVGRQALTLSEVTDRSGQVKIEGETWSARTELLGQVLPTDARVRVVRIDGATAVVAPLTPDEPPSPVDLPANDLPEEPR
ncbi:MAG TPA: NfeD family protein, partial [Actinotalea sp.]|nr:NfeD family protein [Actinotalea sp.]